jgi:hypothetical protein
VSVSSSLLLLLLLENSSPLSMSRMISSPPRLLPLPLLLLDSTLNGVRG